MTEGAIPWHRDGGDWSEIEKALEHFNLSPAQWKSVRLRLLLGRGSSFERYEMERKRAGLPSQHIKNACLDFEMARAIELLDKLALSRWGNKGVLDSPDHYDDFVEGRLENFEPIGLKLYRDIRHSLYVIKNRCIRDANFYDEFIVDQKKKKPKNNYNNFKNRLFGRISEIW